MEENWEKLKEIIEKTDNIVFFGGAGVSTESGIPDFRSVDGLYNQKYEYPPETIRSHTFYRRNPEEFFRFYRDKMLCPDALPNAAHRKLAQWEQEGKLKAVVTQNIDVCPNAAAEAVSSRMWCCMKRGWTMGSSPGLWNISAGRTCCLSAGLPSQYILRQA